MRPAAAAVGDAALAADEAQPPAAGAQHGHAHGRGRGDTAELQRCGAAEALGGHVRTREASDVAWKCNEMQ